MGVLAAVLALGAYFVGQRLERIRGASAENDLIQANEVSRQALRGQERLRLENSRQREELNSQRRAGERLRKKIFGNSIEQ